EHREQRAPRLGRAVGHLPAHVPERARHHGELQLLHVDVPPGATAKGHVEGERRRGEDEADVLCELRAAAQDLRREPHEVVAGGAEAVAEHDDGAQLAAGLRGPVEHAAVEPADLGVDDAHGLPRFPAARAPLAREHYHIDVHPDGDFEVRFFAALGALASLLLHAAVLLVFLTGRTSDEPTPPPLTVEIVRERTRAPDEGSPPAPDTPPPPAPASD